MKKLANLKGVKALNKMQQKSITGGVIECDSHLDCSHVCGFCTSIGICLYPEYGCNQP